MWKILSMTILKELASVQEWAHKLKYKMAKSKQTNITKISTKLSFKYEESFNRSGLAL